MMRHIIAILILYSIATGCAVIQPGVVVTSCENTSPETGTFRNSVELKQYLDSLQNMSIPGVAMAIYSKDGMWEYANGYARIEDRTAMQTCHLHYLQSIAKTYLAVAIMKLYEEDKIDLNASFLNYLPDKFLQYVEYRDTVTVKMLLNHTAGIPEYNSDPNYLSQLLQSPGTDFTTEDYFMIIEGKPLLYIPGSRYRYCNMAYEILAVMVDNITGDHAAYISEEILKPLGLNQTYYRSDPGYLDYKHIYNAYWDRNSNGIIENVSELQRQNVSDMIGDDGIVSTPRDAVLFLKGLMEGKIISNESLQLMKEWLVNKKGDFTYGLGLDYAKFNGEVAHGHSGGGLGAGCQLYYFPDRDIYFYIGINLGTVTESVIHDKAEPLLEKIYEAMLE